LGDAYRIARALVEPARLLVEVARRLVLVLHPRDLGQARKALSLPRQPARALVEPARLLVEA